MGTIRLFRNPFASRERVKRRIVQRYFLRWDMTLILAGVVLSGVVASRLLLFLGVSAMPIRYLLAVTCSYGIFFLLVRIWLSYVMRTASENYAAVDLDIVPTNFPGVGPGSSGGSPVFEGHGGSFGGGGAGGSFEDVSASADVPGAASADLSDLKAPAAPVHSSSGGGWGFDLDLDDGFVILVVFLLLLAVIFGAGGYLVYVAPEILSEAAFQAILAGALAKASRKMKGEGWTGGVLRSTWLPYVIVLAMAGIFGWVAHAHCPGAAKLLEVFRGCVAVH